MFTTLKVLALISRVVGVNDTASDPPFVHLMVLTLPFSSWKKLFTVGKVRFLGGKFR